MLQSLFNATLSLLLFRAGPQDFPYAPAATRWLVPFAALVTYAVQLQVYPPLMAMAMALASIIGLGFATRILLRVRRLEARFMQTYHSLLAVTTVMTFALWPVIASIAPELERLSTVSTPLDKAPPVTLPGGAVLMILLLATWNFAVNANIYRHAANLTAGRGVVVALLIAVALQTFVLFFAALAGALGGNAAG